MTVFRTIQLLCAFTALSVVADQPVAVAPVVPLLNWGFEPDVPFPRLEQIVADGSGRDRLQQAGAIPGGLIDGANGKALRLHQADAYRLRRAEGRDWIDGRRGFCMMFRIRVDSFLQLGSTKGPPILTLSAGTRPWISLQCRWSSPAETEKESPRRGRIGLWFRSGEEEKGILVHSDLIEAEEWVHVALSYNPEDEDAPLRWYLNGALLYGHPKKINFPGLDVLSLSGEGSSGEWQAALDDFCLYEEPLFSRHIEQLAGAVPDEVFRSMRKFRSPAAWKGLVSKEDAQRRRHFGLDLQTSQVARICGELHTAPIILDGDGDGLPDLFSTAAGGAWFHRRIADDLFEPPVIFEPAYNGSGHKNLRAASVSGGIPGAIENGRWYPDFCQTGFQNPVKLPGLDSTKKQQIYFADYDGDGTEDAVSFQKGGCVWFKNVGSHHDPSFVKQGEAKTTTGGALRISPAAVPFDWDADGDWDLIFNQDRDALMVVENVALPGRIPVYRDQPVALMIGNKKPFRYISQNLNLAVSDWDQDGDSDIIMTGQSGNFYWLENGGVGSGGWRERGFFKQVGGQLAFGALITPSAGDLDGDGHDDLVCGNSDGFLCWFKNLGMNGDGRAEWASPELIISSGKAYRFMAGETLSAQGAGERKYGYTTPSVTDWDMDGLPDILLNTIAGKVLWLRNTGEKSRPEFSEAIPVEVAWDGAPQQSPWSTFIAGSTELPVQWRTSVDAVDWNRDGLVDLMVVDHEGYLAWMQRAYKEGRLVLLPPERVFECTDTDFVYDYSNYREFKDVNGDGWNDFRMRDGQGKLVYHFRDSVSRMGRDKRNRRFKFTISNDNNSFSDPAGRDVKQLSPELIQSYQRLGDEENCLFRLNGGWGGQSGRRKFDFVDWDGDGDLDLLVNHQYYGAALFKNIKQSGVRAVFSDQGPLFDIRVGAHTSCPTWTDLNRDGIPDLLFGDEHGGLIYIERGSFTDLPGRGLCW